MDKYIGKMLDNRYEILEIIGVGGMAVVYKARCHRLNRLVAVKVLKEDFSGDDDFRRRFHAESQAVAMLSHPNIVAVYDVSRSNEVEYIVMELIDGITLKQYMQKKGVLNWRESLHFTTQIVKALSHAHSRGIIHRDIKPHNIMILRDGSVKVADFGIARFASKQNTLTQEALGSVHYISPEQARGSHIDARSDLYSVGVVMYEMLTGRLPYEGDSPVSVAIQHINSMPLSPREVNPDIPDALEAITQRAMAGNLSKRYANAEDMLGALEDFRKNPSIRFGYDLNDAVLDTEEPTRPIPNGEILAAEAAALESRNAKTAAKRRGRSQEDRTESENINRRRTNSSIATMTGILGVLLFLGILTFVVIKLVDSILPDDDMVLYKVPYLQGRVYNKEALKNDYPHLQFTAVEEYSLDYTKDTIMSQDPKPQKEVPEGTEVTLYISLGKAPVTIPDVKDMTLREAQFALDAVDLRFTPVFEVHDTVARDTVIRTEPDISTVVEAGDTITLVISMGPEIKYHDVPKLEGQRYEAVKAMLDEYKFIAVLEYSYHETLGEGYIISQSVLARTSLEEYSEITLVISQGPEPTPPPTPSPSPTPTPEPPVSSEPPITSPSAEPVWTVMNKELTLPTDREEVEVRIERHDAEGTVVVYRNTLSTEQGKVSIPVEGYVGDDCSVYYDGEFVTSFMLQ